MPSDVVGLGRSINASTATSRFQCVARNRNPILNVGYLSAFIHAC